MKTFLNNYNFNNLYDHDILKRGEGYYYKGRILDIWCYKDLITAYVEGSEIYRIELKASSNKLYCFSCSCPYSEEGERMCKHVVAVLYYLQDNKVPEIESNEEKGEKDNSHLSEIYKRMKYELDRISDREGYVDYYNGKYFVELISDVSYDIDSFIDNEEYDNAFELIKYTFNFINDTRMDGSSGEYQDSFYSIIESASRLLYIEEYYDLFLEYTKFVDLNNLFGDLSDAPLYAFILYAHDYDSATKVIDMLENNDFDSFSFFVDYTQDKIVLTYDFIDKEKAIKMCYEDINSFGVMDLLIKYLKNDNRIKEAEKILKEDVQNHPRKDLAYNKLLDLYDEYNMIDEKKKILPEVIIETSDFKKYKELKYMYDLKEWNLIKDYIIPKINKDKINLLEEIYAEEKDVDKLYEFIKKDHGLYNLAKFQDVLKNKYGKELLNFYKEKIIETAPLASSRKTYREIAYYIEKMEEIDNSGDFIYDMLEEMYPYYRKEKAFKEEIENVLSAKNMQKFSILNDK